MTAVLPDISFRSTNWKAVRKARQEHRRRVAARYPAGFSAIGVVHGKSEVNIGTLFRSATLYEAAFVFTVGRRYDRQSSDTARTPLHTPLFNFETVDDLVRHLPWSCPLVGVEMDERATLLSDFKHPERACYLLGAEDHGLTQEAVLRCHDLVQIESPGSSSMNVSTAGTLVLHHRYVQRTGGRA